MMQTTRVPADVAQLGLQALIDQIDADLAAMPEAPNRDELLALRQSAIAELAKLGIAMPVDMSPTKANLANTEEPNISGALHAQARLYTALQDSAYSGEGTWAWVPGEDELIATACRIHEAGTSLEFAMVAELMARLLDTIVMLSHDEKSLLLSQIDLFASDFPIRPHLIEKLATMSTYDELLIALMVASLLDRILGLADKQLATRT